MRYKLILERLLTTANEPIKKFVYENGEKTEKIAGYAYRLLDIDNGEAITVTLPKLKELPSKTYVTVLNPVGTPYKTQHGAVMMSIKADDIHKANS